MQENRSPNKRLPVFLALTLLAITHPTPGTIIGTPYTGTHAIAFYVNEANPLERIANTRQLEVRISELEGQLSKPGTDVEPGATSAPASLGFLALRPKEISFFQNDSDTSA